MMTHIITVKVVEAAGKGVMGCRIARQNLQVLIAVFVAWGQCELGFQAGKWESGTEQWWLFKRHKRTEAFIFRGCRH
jgi:hypothetical protein